MLETRRPRPRRHGAHDLEDIDTANTLISFTGPVGKGGRHIEHGYALARGLRIVIIGPRDNIFHCHPDTEVYPGWDTFLIAERTRTRPPTPSTLRDS